MVGATLHLNICGTGRTIISTPAQVTGGPAYARDDVTHSRQ